MKTEPTKFDHDLLIRLDESVKRIEKTLNDLIEKISNGYVKTIEFQDHEDRINKLESTGTWINRLVLGIIITAVIGLILKENLL